MKEYPKVAVVRRLTRTEAAQPLPGAYPMSHFLAVTRHARRLLLTSSQFANCRQDPPLATQEDIAEEYCVVFRLLTMSFGASWFSFWAFRFCFVRI
jgi:hypothetical protein